MFDRLVDDMLITERHRPAWLNSTMVGGALLLWLTFKKAGGLVGLGSLAVVGVVREGPIALLWLAVLLGTATLAGLVGGFTFGILGFLRNGSIVGEWLSWTAGIAAYLAAVIAALNEVGIDEIPPSDPVTWYAILILAGFWGTFMAWPSRVRQEPHVPWSLAERQAFEAAAPRRLWATVEARLEELAHRYAVDLHHATTAVEQRRASCHLHDQLADLDRLERTLHQSDALKRSATVELAALARWRATVHEAMRDLEAA